MNYKKIYCNLIKSRLKNPPKQNFEIHHILPKSLFPEKAKDKNNLVKLEYRAHYIAHHLLYRHYKSIGDKNGMHKMALAWFRMCKNTNGLHVSLNMYEKAKIVYANSQKGRKPSEQHKRKISKTLKEKWKNDTQFKKYISKIRKEFSNRPDCIEKHRKIKVKKVLCIETGEIFYSASEASRIKEINRGNLCTCCRCQKGTVGGYHWKYV